MRRRGRSFGLRPRLLAALVFTAVVTLATAALALLPPLQDRLRRESADTLRSTVLAARPGLQNALNTRDRVDREIAIANRSFDLDRRADARIIITSGYPTVEMLSDTGADVALGSNAAPAIAYRALQLQDGGVERIIAGNQATIAVRLFVPGRRDAAGVVIAQKQLDDVSAAVAQVRNAFLAAAAIGLGVATLLGVALATTLSRRLARLRAAAVRVAEEGTDAPPPRDSGSDEVGDLARALATMQEGLRRQEAARRAFVATASHELRTPLTSLSGTLELLREDLSEGGIDLRDADDQVRRAQGELARLTRLASQLLDLSRLDAAVPLRSEPVELGELCRAVAAEFDLRAGERSIVIEVAEPPGPCWASGDPDAVARIVRILLDNALRHAPRGSTIAAAPSYHGDSATVIVSDIGAGVPVADRERIFERFERGSTPTGESGFGLGLAIGRELAERMGGRLRLAEGPGARFVLMLGIELPGGGAADGEAAPRLSERR